MADRILVAFDGSAPSETALEYALETFPDAEVTALYVIEVPEWQRRVTDGPSLTLPVTDRAREYAAHLLEDARKLAAERGRDLETEIAAGDPAYRIIDRATEQECDTIVVGAHGRTEISRVLLGSVVETVTRRSPIPVVVVR